MRRARYRAKAKAQGGGGHPLFQIEATGERTRLIGSPSSQAGVTASAGEIGIGLGIAHLLHPPFDAHLTAQGLLVQGEGGKGVGEQFLTLTAFEIGVKHKATGIDTLEQYHPRRRPTIRPNGG